MALSAGHRPRKPWISQADEKGSRAASVTSTARVTHDDDWESRQILLALGQPDSCYAVFRVGDKR